jgi:Flp pilus assembly protein TadD
MAKLWVFLKKFLWEVILVQVLGTGAGGYWLWQHQAHQQLTPAQEQEFATRVRAAFAESAGHTADRPAKLAATVAAFAQEQAAPPQKLETLGRRLSARLESAEESNGRGTDLVGEGRYAEARREFHSACAVDPEGPAGWSNLGAVQLLLGQIEAGRQAYDKALELDPDDAVTRFNFAVFFARTGQEESAARQIERAFASAAAGGDPRLRETMARDLRNNPHLATVRQDPRVRRLLRES